MCSTTAIFLAEEVGCISAAGKAFTRPGIGATTAFTQQTPIALFDCLARSLIHFGFGNFVGFGFFLFGSVHRRARQSRNTQAQARQEKFAEFNHKQSAFMMVV